MAVEKPNILLIIADDLGVDTFHVDDATDTATVKLGSIGPYPLPNLSRLVAKGVHLTHAWAHPVCTPSRSALFSGLNPWRTTLGDAGEGPALPAKLPSDGVTDLKTLGDLVSAQGYQCGFFGKWDLGLDHTTEVPTVRGWHRHEGILEGGLRGIPYDTTKQAVYEKHIQKDVRYVAWEKIICDKYLGMVRDKITMEERTYPYATEDGVLSARDWIKHVDGCPWWATISLIAPHDPFHVPPQGTYTIQFHDPANPTIQEMFVAMMEALDYYLGKLFNDSSPQIQNQLKKTVILFVGDNGSQDELDLIGGDDKGSVYIGGVHVPLILADGGAVFGDEPCYLDTDQLSSEKRQLVHIVDIFQTIVDIAGSSGPDYTTDSVSMLPYMKNTTGDARFAQWQPRTHLFGQLFVPPNSPNPNKQERYKRLGERATISDGTYKLNYQNGQYEFAEVLFDPATDILTERVTNDFQHPKALELWQALTTPGSRYYAEMDDHGRTFPPLSEASHIGPQLIGIGMDNQLYYRETLTSNWVPVPNSGSVIGITVLPDGRLLGAGTDHQLWYRETLTSNWVLVPNSGSVLGITVLQDGKIVGVGTDHQLWYRETLTSTWVLVPNSGSVVDITTMADGKILGIGTDCQLWVWNRDYLTSGWSLVPNSGSVISITTLSDGKIVGVGTDHQLWYRSALTSSWNLVSNSGAVIGVTNGITVRRYKEYS